MDYYSALIVIPNLIAFAVTAWVAYRVYAGKRTEHRLAMAICFAFISINSLVLLGEKMIADLDLALAMVVIEYVCELVILVSLLVFVMQYIGMGRLVKPRNVLILGSPGLLAIILNATNPWHELFYESVTVVEKHGFFIFDAEYGPFFIIWIGYFLVVIVTTTVLMARTLIDAPADRKGALWVLMLAMVITMITGVIYVLSAKTDPLVDVLSIGLTATALTIFFGERRLDFTDLEIIRFKEAIGGMDDAILILDSALKVVYANQPGQELLEQNSDFIWGRMRARGLKIPAGSNKWETALNLNGAPRNYILSTSDIFREGKPIGAVLIFHDISSRKGLEEDLRRANRGLSTLNQIIRHDMKNDLTALWGYLELLRSTDLSEKQRELVRKMTERARSADDHLTFAKYNQSSGVMTTKWHEVQTIVKDAMEQAGINDIRAEVNLDGIRVLADPMLSNVFYCLADNTLRHGSGAKEISVRGENTETGLSIVWEDDGVGVQLEDKQLIFNQGFGQNTGQGLFLAREILSMTGFTISEEGRPGFGARFVIRIPSGWYTWTRPVAS